jgi:hypothetical protein
MCRPDSGLSLSNSNFCSRSKTLKKSCEARPAAPNRDSAPFRGYALLFQYAREIRNSAARRLFDGLDVIESLVRLVDRYQVHAQPECAVVEKFQNGAQFRLVRLDEFYDQDRSRASEDVIASS